MELSDEITPQICISSLDIRHNILICQQHKFGVMFASVLLLPVSQKPFSGVTEDMKAITKLLCFLSVLALCSVYEFGQRDTGTITGTVTDPSGAVVSGATVTAKSVGTGE